MEVNELRDEYASLALEVKVGSAVEGVFENAEFFRLFSSVSSENGDTPDLEYAPVLHSGRNSHRIDGYALDVSEDTGGESIELHLAISSYFQDDEMPVLHKKDIEQTVSLAKRFFLRSFDNDYYGLLEEESCEFQLMDLIRRKLPSLSRIRLIVFTNAHFKSRNPNFSEGQWRDKEVHVNVLDISRYAQICSFGFEPIEINFEEEYSGNVPVLRPELDGDQCFSYLFAIRGDILAEIYSQYGARLLEQNVRTYLQAKTNVNKGILKTISDEPEMFFAYNNGVTATASEVVSAVGRDGGLEISEIKGLQIVNGGQTTASLLYARDVLKRPLDRVYVQVKLSVVPAERLELVVPKISEYANTQNKVSLADLASNSPAQIAVERLSNEVIPPVGMGEASSKRWFYERSRGRYKNMLAYKTPSERKRIELDYPRSQLISKPDLAKYEYAFDGMPHVVSLGAQKCFLKYTVTLRDLFNRKEINECWYKRAIGKAIFFKALDSAVSKQDWYSADRGYKAQIVAYGVSSCAKLFRDQGCQIDLDMIWRLQSVPDRLLSWMLDVTEGVASVLKSPPKNVVNISEFAKKAFCWEGHVIPSLSPAPEEMVQRYGVSIVDFSAQATGSAREEIRNQELDFDVFLASLVGKAFDIKKKLESEGLASPKNMSALSKLSIGNLNLNKGEKNALKLALQRLDYEFGSSK